MPKISVIVAVYNVEEYLRRSLDCLVNQTLNDLEFICVDDCSTDNSLAILQEYAQKDSRFKIISSEVNGGAAIARNKGLEVATGDYLGFIDPDDAIDLNFYEELYKKALETNSDIVKCPRKNINTNGKEYIGYIHEEIRKEGLYAFCIEWTTAIYKSSIIFDNNIRFNDKIIKGQDVVFLNKIILKSNKFALIDNVYYYYYKREGSLNSKILSWNKFQSAVNALSEIIYNINSSDIHEKDKHGYKIMYKFRYKSFFPFFYKTDDKNARELLAKAVISAWQNCKEQFFLEKTFEYKILIPSLKDGNLQDLLKIINKYKSVKKLKNAHNKNSFIENIFSVKNIDKHKVITLLGIKFNIKYDKAAQREHKNEKNYITVQKNYKKVLAKLSEKIKTEPLNVVFLSNEPQKWTYDSLYREFEKNEHFNPIVLVYPRERTLSGKDKTLTPIEQHYQFFKEKNINVDYYYKNGTFVDLKTFNPDIVFYTQLAELEQYDSPVQISEYALTCYSPYGSQVADDKKEYLQNFHKLLWLYICESDLNIKRFEGYKKGNSKNCKSFGYPKLDVYIKNHDKDPSKYWKEPDKIKVIYAPHHSACGSNFAYGTFLENGEFILELAKKYSDTTTWIFKPHPMLKYKLLNSEYMSEEEVEQYYAQWDKIGEYYNSGDYFDIIQTSDLMITDCASFLIEYLPTGKPLIRLINPKAVRPSEYGKYFTSQYYNSFNNDELEKLFVDLAINKNDYKKEERKKLISELIDFNEPSAVKIMKYLSEKINN